MATTVADLTAMLRLNNANFKKGLGGAEKALKGFQGQVKQLKGIMIGAFTITGAIATFKKAIASTQETNDTFVASMEAAREATTQLLASIATGDFSGLINNMRNAAKAGKEFAEAMDEVADRSRSIRIQTALAEKNIYKLREVATDTAKSDQERIVAYREVLKLTSQQIIAERKITEDALEAHIQKQITRNNLTREQGELIKDFVTNYEQLSGNELDSVRNVKALKDEWERLEKRVSQLSQQGITGDILKGAALAADEAKASYERMLPTLTNTEKKYWEINEALNKMTDEERDGIAQLIIDGAKLEQKLQSLQNEAVRGVGAIERKAKDSTEAVDDLTDSLSDLGEEALEVEDWMADFWKEGAIPGASEETQAKAGLALDNIIDSLETKFPEAADETMKAGAQVVLMLSNQFSQLGNAIGKTIAGIKGSLAELAVSILENIGNILMMIGLSMGFTGAGLPFIIAGAAIQLGGGLFGGLGKSVNTGRMGTAGSDTVKFEISGKNLVGVLDRQTDYTNRFT